MKLFAIVAYYFFDGEECQYFLVYTAGFWHQRESPPPRACLSTEAHVFSDRDEIQTSPMTARSFGLRGADSELLGAVT